MNKSIIIIMGVLLLCTGLTATGFMGVFLSEMEIEDLEKKGFKGGYGIALASIQEDTPADKAGLKKGDLILKLNGEKVYTIDQLHKMLDPTKPGDKVQFVIWRNKKEKSFTLKLADKADFLPKDTFLGIQCVPITKKQSKTLDVTYGVVIKHIVEDSPAEKAELKKKDIILKFDGEKAYTFDQLSKMIQAKKPDEKVKVELIRDGKKKSINVKLGYRLKSTSSDMFFFNQPSKLFAYSKQSESKNIIGFIVKQEKKKDEESSVVISKILKDLPAEKVGLKVGDILLEINGKKIF